MTTRLSSKCKVLLTATLGLPLAICSALPASASPPESRPKGCVFDTYVPRAVEPYYVDQSIGLGPAQTLRGAALFVPAREGLTMEWLELRFRDAFASQTAQHGCLPKVRNVEISVGSGGYGFWVYLGSAHSADELLRWAKTKLAQKKA